MSFAISPTAKPLIKSLSGRNSLIGSQGVKGPTGSNPGKKIAGYNQASLQQFTPEQMDLFSQLFGQVSPDSFTSKLAQGDESQFEQLEAPALKQFNELQGNLSSRFSGMGMGARRSSGFQNASSQAASDLAQQLQSNRTSLQQQAIRDLMGMSTDLLNQRPYENFLVRPQEKRSIWQKLLGIGAPVAGAVAGGMLGGPAGAAVGGNLGSTFASGFSGDGGGANYSGIGQLSNKWGA